MISSRQFLAVMSAVLVSIVSTSVFAAGKDDKTTTDDWYQWSLNGKPAGYFHTLRKASGVKEAPVLLVHEFVIRPRGKRLSLKMETFCRDDECLTPVQIVSEGEGTDEFATFVAEIRWPRDPEGAGKLTADVAGDPPRRIEIELPPRTTALFGVFEIARCLPFEKGKVFEFACLEAGELNLKTDEKLAYLGIEELDIEGRRTRLHKFQQAGSRIRSTYYWVSEDRRLVRVLMDERKEFLLTTEQKAKAALE